jgi:hypothetical protein
MLGVHRGYLSIDIHGPPSSKSLWIDQDRDKIEMRSKQIHFQQIVVKYVSKDMIKVSAQRRNLWNTMACNDSMALD